MHLLRPKRMCRIGDGSFIERRFASCARKRRSRWGKNCAAPIAPDRQRSRLAKGRQADGLLHHNEVKGAVAEVVHVIEHRVYYKGALQIAVAIMHLFHMIPTNATPQLWKLQKVSTLVQQHMNLKVLAISLRYITPRNSFGCEVLLFNLATDGTIMQCSSHLKTHQQYAYIHTQFLSFQWGCLCVLKMGT